MAENIQARLKATIPGYQPGMPAHRMDEVTFMDELELMWGRKWGAQSDMGELKLAIVHGPGPESVDDEVLADPVPFFAFGEVGESYDLERHQQQHDELVAALRSEGVEVIYANFPSDIHGVYTKSLRGIMALEASVINGGAVIPRCGVPWKKGCEKAWTQKLAELGCPILFTVHGRGIHDVRANTVWLDPEHCVVGCSLRTNLEGIRQVEPIFRYAGVKDLHIAYLPGPLYTRKRAGFCAAYHLDMVFGMVAERLAIIYPGGIDYDTIAYLRHKGIKLIEVPEEEAVNAAANALAVRPGVVIIPAGNPVTIAALRREGCRVVEVDLSEFSTRGIGPVCLTGPLIRKPGPYLGA
ncbi:MAG: hypothetical protein HYU86_02910 [Chloroflexi bacterium]|nr:hypothetical protein [Chloroflexota bacterium]